MASLDRYLTIDDLKQAAKRRVPKQFFDYADRMGFRSNGRYPTRDELHERR